MEKLYVIFEENKTCVIKEVSVLKETEKQMIINCEGVERKVLFKNSLERFVDEYIFGYDKTILIELWNSHIEANLMYLKKQVQRVKNLSIDESQKQKLLEEN